MATVLDRPASAAHRWILPLKQAETGRQSGPDESRRSIKPGWTTSRRGQLAVDSLQFLPAGLETDRNRARTERPPGHPTRPFASNPATYAPPFRYNR